MKQGLLRRNSFWLALSLVLMLLSAVVASAVQTVGALAEHCKFRDCQHHAEPGCAVRAAVEAGTLAAERLASFHKLAGEQVVNAADQKTARRLAETRKAKAKRYVPRSGKPED